MTFTDDDLKRLSKECDEITMDCAASVFKGGPAFHLRMMKHCAAVKALLTRLEVAEKVCEGAEIMLNESTPFQDGLLMRYTHNTGRVEVPLKAWRKAAGK